MFHFDCANKAFALPQPPAAAINLYALTQGPRAAGWRRGIGADQYPSSALNEPASQRCRLLSVIMRQRLIDSILQDACCWSTACPCGMADV